MRGADRSAFPVRRQGGLRQNQQEILPAITHKLSINAASHRTRNWPVLRQLFRTDLVAMAVTLMVFEKIPHQGWSEAEGRQAHVITVGIPH